MATKDQLWEARDASIASLSNSWNGISNWWLISLQVDRDYTLEDLKEDAALLESCQERLVASLSNDVLREIESRSVGKLAEVTLHGQSFATAHEASKRAIRLALLAAGSLAYADPCSSDWKEQAQQTHRDHIWEPAEQTALIARVKQEWAMASEHLGESDEEWSRPMSLSEAAKLLGCKDSKKAAYMQKLMEDGVVVGRKINRQKWEFRLDTIDPAVRDQFRRTGLTRANSR